MTVSYPRWESPNLKRKMMFIRTFSHKNLYLSCPVMTRPENNASWDINWPNKTIKNPISFAEIKAMATSCLRAFISMSAMEKITQLSCHVDKSLKHPGKYHWPSVQWHQQWMCIHHPEDQGAVSIRKTVLPGMAIPMLKIRRPNGRLIFNMGIPIPGKDGLYIETGPSNPKL